MEEIAENVFIEDVYPRTILGILKLNNGTVMVDLPFRFEDAQSWKAVTNKISNDEKRLLLLLDAHIDRTLTTQAMETNVIVHDNAVDIINNRSSSAKSHELEVGPDWSHNELSPGIRFCKPHMTFSDEISVHWGDEPLVITHKSGAHFAGSWLIYEAQKVVFIGDSVVVDQPPFFAKADLTRWIADLEWLQSDRFKNFKIVSGRNGLIDHQSIRTMSALLSTTKVLIEALVEDEIFLGGISELTSQLIEKIEFDPQQQDRYFYRLNHGLEQYIRRHYSKNAPEVKGDEK